MHDWFCQIELIESIWQKKGELRESLNVNIFVSLRENILIFGLLTTDYIFPGLKMFVVGIAGHYVTLLNQQNGLQ